MPQPVASALTPQIWYQKSADCGSPTGYWESDGVCGETTYFLPGKKQTHPPCDLTAHMTLGERWVVKVGHYSQKLLPVICYFQVPSKSVAYQMGCDLTVSCPDESSHMLVCWGKSFAVSSSEQRKHVTWVLWTDGKSWIQSLFTFDGQIFPFSTTICWSEKHFSTYLLWSNKNIHLSSNDIPLLLKAN